MIEELRQYFENIYGDSNDTRIFFAPGRVNLIGEHIDYNGGHVFPCALNFGTYVIAKKRNDDLVRLYSKNFEELGIMEFSLNDLVYQKEHDWANYPKGVIHIFKKMGLSLDVGFDAVYFGNIPNGAGLSSSASVELATSVMLKELFRFDVDMITMVKMSQRAENEFVGVNCGIMDQFAVGMGKKDNAILLDCDTLEYRYSSIQLKDASLVITNTNKRRGLADSKYNERRSECERALSQLKTKLDIESLGELTEEQFEENKHLITNETDRKRAKHAVYENRRTLKAVEALERGDLKEFGELMKESHISLRDDYEVTGKELDTLVELAWGQQGTIGSRMTGAGFGGCTVSIVENDKIDKFIENVGKKYKEIIGYEATFYVAKIGDGAKEIK
ncbi:galactokinase [Caldisalinibacter kiritimatiensis]|uniref:Galactokinase n=1 Tax=Caldisalinibacter kiritimatiensis TaxID=1304284 RepID=R1CW89_9FIRM|nr:galactokinase [Caldisalinibacter kiritimatiensis]EOD00899.1 Galactokinase [Caldisalinibacter kiritimatiensis]